ncbi:hypothetical protein CSHISOI_07240 [Colletotrichum shisoi]|uniref:Uncharacterized protein n=1 Tax=Colletotrichum shisoi TaxID=2078593 RepID=A0A5Q4BMP5_9PEZI|nr:hypothetical protein CSHISOI_07240 [Colletotrichum shisoi]
MANPTIVLETHFYSNSPNGLPPWVRSFHLRLSPTGTKADILKLVRDSMVRLGRADPIAEAQITLYWTQHGRVVSIPGTSPSNFMVTLPIYQPPQFVNFNVGYHAAIPQQTQVPMNSEYPLALTYSGGTNYLHSYGPSPAMMPPAIIPSQQTWMFGGSHSYVNVPVFDTGGGGISSLPIVSDVVRETRLDALAEEGLAGVLEWAAGPTGLKLIVMVDVDSRTIISSSVPVPLASSPAPAPSTAPATPTTPASPTPATPPGPAA